MSSKCFKCHEDVPEEFIFPYEPLQVNDESLYKEVCSLCSHCWILTRNVDLQYLHDRLVHGLPQIKEDDPKIKEVNETITFLSDTISKINEVLETGDISSLQSDHN